MKQHRKIALFLISLFSFFFMADSLCSNDVSYQLETNSESLVVEEEREVSLEFQEIIDETQDISGGHPDIVLNTPSITLSKELTPIVSIKDIKLKNISKCFYLGKTPLYLRYQALKLHC